MDKRVLAIITARGGSKGVPRKNVKDFGGKPLIAYTIDIAKRSKAITDLIVSTDDQEIAEIAGKLGVEIPFIRPAELAQDNTPHLPVVQHAITHMENARGYTYDYIVILQPTSPFRLVEDIDETIALIEKTDADSAVSIVEIESGKHPMKAKRLDGQNVLPYFMDEPEGRRRQDLPPAYRRSGHVYVMKRDLFMKENKLFGNHIVGHIVPQERYVDIDTEFDWVTAEYMLRKFREKGLYL